jgi:hypothetical protein
VRMVQANVAGKLIRHGRSGDRRINGSAMARTSPISAPSGKEPAFT